MVLVATREMASGMTKGRSVKKGSFFEDTAAGKGRAHRKQKRHCNAHRSTEDVQRWKFTQAGYSKGFHRSTDIR